MESVWLIFMYPKIQQVRISETQTFAGNHSKNNLSKKYVYLKWKNDSIFPVQRNFSRDKNAKS